MKVSAVLRVMKSPDSIRDAKIYIRLFVKRGEVIRVATPLMVIAEYWDTKSLSYKLDTPNDLICTEEQELVNLHIRRVFKMIESRYHTGCDSAWLIELLSSYQFTTLNAVLPAVSRGRISKSSTQMCYSDTPLVKSNVPHTQSPDTQTEIKSDTITMKSSTIKPQKKSKCASPAKESSTSEHTSSTISPDELVKPIYRPKGYNPEHINKSESELNYEAMVQAASDDDTIYMISCFEQYLAESNFNDWWKIRSGLTHRGGTR